MEIDRELETRCAMTRCKPGISHGKEVNGIVSWKVPEISTDLNVLDNIIIQDNYAGKTDETLNRTLGPDNDVRGYLPFRWKPVRKQKIEENED